MDDSKKRLFFVELNEYNEQLITTAAERYDLQNLKWFLGLRKLSVTTEDIAESEFLEPWSQWVSVHTGEPAPEHQIKHLGDVDSLELPQFWEVLSDHNISSAIVGSLNAKRGAATECSVFLPDPWTFSENAYPIEFQSLIDLPRYLAKNRTSWSVIELLQLLFKYFRAIWKIGGVAVLLRLLPLWLKEIMMSGPKAYIGFAVIEVLAAEFLLTQMKYKKPMLSVLFINSIAHVQHYYWDSNEISKPCAYVFKIVDHVFGRIREHSDQFDDIMVVNALSQKNTIDEVSFYLYRPTDHRRLLRALDVQGEFEVEALMSYDATLIFSGETAAKAAQKTLDSVRIKSNHMFFTEIHPNEPSRLFYRVIYSDHTDPGARFRVGDLGRDLPFWEYFTLLIKRTGRHQQSSSVYTSADLEPGCVPKFNHQIFDLVLNYFNLSREHSKVRSHHAPARDHHSTISTDFSS